MSNQPIIFNRIWEMPNSRTFKIRAIKNLICKYIAKDNLIIDPFANECSIKEYLKDTKYISNDLDNSFDTNYHLDAKEFMRLFDDNSVDIVLFDPPYSPRQVSECYKKLGKTVTMKDTSSAYISEFRKEIARILKPNGLCISCAWNTNGIGKNLGFQIIEILDIAHGGSHNDTLVTVEKKNDQ